MPRSELGAFALWPLVVVFIGSCSGQAASGPVTTLFLSGAEVLLEVMARALTELS